jgi:galactose mutarotase-like enzyme
MGSERVRIANESISVTIATKGAEPQSLRDDRDVEYLWQAGPQWRRHAPILFPAICRVGEDDLVRVGYASFPMSQHGFARDSEFTVVDVTESSAAYVLTSSSQTRAHFPFDFALAVSYSVIGSALRTSYVVTNTGDVDLGFGIGSHPAFVWSDGADADPAMGELAFEEPEPHEFRRVVDNLLSPQSYPSLARGGSMALRREQFADDAIIMTDVDSSSLRFGSAGGREIELSWEGFAGVTIWTAKDAEFLCVEVWRGEPAPQGFHSDWSEKPGNLVLAPGAKASLSYTIALL